MTALTSSMRRHEAGVWRAHVLAHVLVLLGYLVLALVFTYPLVINFATAIPGDGYDGLQNYWNLWWVRRALLDLNSSPFFTTDLYYPTGTSLLFHTLNVFNGLWSLPIQLLSNLAITYNVVVLFTFVMSGYGTFLLAKHVTSRGRLPTSDFIAFVAGFIFAFAPVRFAHLLGHMQVLSTEWLPFFALSMLRLYEHVLSPRRIILPALILGLNALCDWYFVLYSLIFAGLVTLWGVRPSVADVGRKSPIGQRLFSAWTPFVLVTLCFVGLLSPLLLPMLREVASASYLQPPFEETVLLSADLLAFVTPSEFHPLWGDATRSVAERFTSSASERTVFAGFMPLSLAAIALWHSRRLDAHGRAMRTYWLLVVFVYFLLALGPYLHVLGQVATPLPLPYAWLYALLPPLRIARSVSRFDIMLMLALSMLAAIGLYRLGRRARLACAFVIAIEFLASPYPLSPIQVPAFYAQLRAEAGSFAILELPINFDRPDPLLYQTLHARPLITAYTSRANPLSLVERTPVLALLRSLQPDIIRYDVRTVAASVLSDLEVRYVINHPLTMGAGDERTVTTDVLHQIFGNEKPLINQPNLVVYRAPAPNPYQPYLVLGAGWGDVALVNGAPERTVQQQAQLFIRARDNQTRSVRVSAHAQGQAVHCTLSQPVEPGARRALGEAEVHSPASIVVPITGNASLFVTCVAPIIVDGLELGDIEADTR